MAKTFELDTTVSLSSLLARAKKAAYANGAILVDDEGSGRFSHELVRGGKKMGATHSGEIRLPFWLTP